MGSRFLDATNGSDKIVAKCGTPQQLMTEWKAGLVQVYGPQPQFVYLFGSYARGEPIFSGTRITIAP